MAVRNAVVNASSAHVRSKCRPRGSEALQHARFRTVIVSCPSVKKQTRVYALYAPGVGGGGRENGTGREVTKTAEGRQREKAKNQHRKRSQGP